MFYEEITKQFIPTQAPCAYVEVRQRDRDIVTQTYGPLFVGEARTIERRLADVIDHEREFTRVVVEPTLAWERA